MNVDFQPQAKIGWWEWRKGGWNWWLARGMNLWEGSEDELEKGVMIGGFYKAVGEGFFCGMRHESASPH